MSQPRAITANELAKLRSHGQQSELYLAIHKPATVMACQVNQAFDTTDDVYQVTYDGVTSGAHTSVLAGMTCYVGSTAGAYDLGMVRIRKAPTATVLYIGETSEIQWADNVYLTVVDEFGLWAKPWYAPTETVVYMDRDVEYADQNTNSHPVPVLGPNEVLWLTGATATFSPTAANSWVNDSTITGYSWAAPGASATANLTTATPTITYNAPGTYRISCTVTAANGKTATGYRVVFVYSAASMPVTAFTLDSCRGEVASNVEEGGGYSFSVTLYDQAALADVHDRAKVILFSRDWYGGVEGSIGQIPGYENIITEGWIDEESIDADPEQGSVKFTVRGPFYWLSKLSAFPAGIKTSSTTTGWRYAETVTVDLMLHHLYHWRSTLDAIMDCYPSSDAHEAFAFSCPQGTLLSQIKAAAGTSILAGPICDRYGRLFVQTDSQYLPTSSRTSIPVVMEITKADWTGRIRVPRKSVGEVSMLETAGGGATETSAYYSESYGKVPGRYGSFETKDGLLVSSQDEINAVTGMIVAERNNPYKGVAIQLAGNNRMIDIAPRQYVTLSLAAEDTPRGVVWTSKPLIPRAVSFSQDPKNGFLQIEIEFDGETWGPPGQTVTPPQGPQTNMPPLTMPELPDFPIVSPDNTWFPPIIPGAGGTPNPCGSSANTPTGPYGMNFSSAIAYAGETVKAYFPCTIRDVNDLSNSTITFDLEFGDDGVDHYHLNFLDNSGNISGSSFALTNTASGYKATFTPSSSFTIGGFALSVDAGGRYQPVTAIASGSFDVTQYGETYVTGLDPAKVYYVRSTGSWIFNPQKDVGSDGIGASGGAGATGTYIATGGAHTGIGGDYTNTYLFPASDGRIKVYFSDSNYSDNSGSQSWAMYECKPSRWVSIKSALVSNVCTG